MATSALMFRHYVMLVLGVFACSLSVFFIRLSETNAIVVVAARLLFSSVLLAPVFWIEWRRHRGAFTREQLQRTLLPAVVLALHLITWTYGARLTLAAQASLLVNLAPVATPFLLHAIIGERIHRMEIIGTLIVVAGVVVLSAEDALRGGGDLWGNVLCFIAMLLGAWYFVLARRNRDVPSLWLYVVPVYACAGIVTLLVAIPWLPTVAYSSGREWSLMLALAIVPTIIGHSFLNGAMRNLRGQTVSLWNTAQFIFAGVIAFFLFNESPALVFYVASALVVAGIALVIFSAPPPPQAEEDLAAVVEPASR